MALAGAAAIPFLLWLFAWELPSSPRPGPNPGGVWVFFFGFDGRPNGVAKSVTDAELRHFLGIVLNGAAANGLITVALVWALAMRGYGNATARLLSIALALGAVSTSYD